MRRAMLTAKAGTPVITVAVPVAGTGAGIAAGASTLNNVSAPSGTGGSLYAVCMSNTSGQTWTAPGAGGWTSVNPTGLPDSTRSIAVFEQATAAGSGANLGTFTRSATATGAMVLLARVTGSGGVQAGGATDATGDPTLPSLTGLTGSNILLLQFVGRLVVAGVFWTQPGGTSLLIDGSTFGTVYEYAIGYDTVNAGSSGTRLWDQSGIGGATKGVVLAINGL